MNLYTLDKVGKTGKCIHLLYICSLVGFYGLWSFVPYTAGGATNLAEFRETKYMLRILWWRIKWRRKSVKSQLFYKMHHGSKFEFILPPRFFSITHGNLLSLSLSLLDISALTNLSSQFIEPLENFLANQRNDFSVGSQNMALMHSWFTCRW